MNKISLKRPVALFMTVVMLLSSAMMYAPAIAHGDGAHDINARIVQGQQIIDEILNIPLVAFVLLEDQYMEAPVAEYGWMKVYDYSEGRRKWVPYVKDFDEEIFSMAIELTGTVDLAVGTHHLTPITDFFGLFFIDWGEYQLEVVENQAPIAGGTTLAGTETNRTDTYIDIDVSALMSDPNNDQGLIIDQVLSLNTAGVVNGAAGTATPLNPTTIRYHQAQYFNGPVEISYTIKDDLLVNNVSEPGVITVNIASQNDAPTAGQITTETDENLMVAIDGLSEADDPDLYDVPLTEVLSVFSATDPTFGSVEIVGNTINYTPGNGYRGTDSFSYTIKDAAGLSATSDVYVEVKGEPDVHLVDLEDNVMIDGTINLNPLDGLGANFGDVITATFTGATFGSVDYFANGQITYDAGSVDGLDVIDYTLYNAFGDMVTGQLSITVYLGNDDIIIDLNPDLDPDYNDTYFIQQYHNTGLYLLDGILWVSKNGAAIDARWIGTSVVHGIQLDDFSTGEIAAGNPVNSYGKFYLTYLASNVDDQTGQSYNYRKLIINYQPVIDINPFELDENHMPMAGVMMTVSPVVEPDLTVYFGDDIVNEGIDNPQMANEGKNLFEELYLHDHEEYPVPIDWLPGDPIEPLTFMPDGIDIFFLLDGEAIDLENDTDRFINYTNIWNVLEVPVGQSFKDYNLRFYATDTMGGVSELTDIFVLRVMNNEPYFIGDNIDVGDDLDNMYSTLYAELGDSIDLWQEVYWYDFEEDWYAGNPAYALTVYYTTQLLDTTPTSVVANGSESAAVPVTDPDYTADTVGFYLVHFTVEDVHTAEDNAWRYLEVNTPPEFTVEPGKEFVIFQVGQTVSEPALWNGIIAADADGDPLTTDALIIEKYTFPVPYVLGELNADGWMMVQVPMPNLTDVQALYRVKYTVEDDPWHNIPGALGGAGFGSDEITRDTWINEDPDMVFGLDDMFRVVGTDHTFDPLNPNDLDGEDLDNFISDLEDDYLGLELMIETDSSPRVEGEFTLAVRVNGDLYDPTDPMVLESGVYYINYHLWDSMGGEYENLVELWVVEDPEVFVEEDMLELELGGHFPTFLGVTAEYWDLEAASTQPTGDTLVILPYDGYIRNYVIAMIGDEILDEIERFTVEDIFTIKYYAVTEVYDDGLPVTFMSEVEMRDLDVTDDPFGDFIYLNDIGGVFIDMLVEIEDITQYPIVVKYNVNDESIRILTTLARPMDVRTSPAEQIPAMWMPVWLDDIAETYTGEIYGISTLPDLLDMGSVLVKYDETIGLFDLVAPLNGLIESYEAIYEEMLDMGVDIYPVTNLAANGNANLVMIVPAHIYDGEMDYMTNIIVELDPLTGDVLVIDILAGEQSEIELDGYPLIMDIAYDETLNLLYGLGINADFDNIYNSTQELFVITDVPVSVDPASAGPEPMVGMHNATVLNTFENTHLYTGAAVKNEELILSKVFLYEEMSESKMASDFDQFAAFINPMTFLDIADIPEDPFVGPYDFTERAIDGLFGYALGAAASFERVLTLTPPSETLNIGAGYTDSAEVTFVPSASPVPAFPDVSTGTWTIVNGGTFVTHTGNGTFTTKPGVGSGNVTIKYTLDGEEVTGTIYVRRYYPQSDPQDDIEPLPVTVTLDIDAITLDYGETADPLFTSYDFTETVRGTTNTAVTWELDDETYVTVDENGVVTTKEGIEADTGDITVELTVRTVVGNATDTATIIFEEQVPLGAIEFFQPYVAGYTDGSFKPQNEVTRAEVATMFTKILSLNTEYPGSPMFADVSENHWAYPYIQAMYRSGIFVGYVDENGVRTFNPESAISRAEIAQVFTNYWGFLDISVTGENLSTIPDVAGAHWASKAINRIYNTEIFTGYAGGLFKPEEPTLREQIVNMINKLISRPPNAAEASRFNDIQPSHPFFGDIEAASQTFLKPQGD